MQVHAAHVATARGAAAQHLLQNKVRTADSAAVSSLWRQFRTCDREASGKLRSGEFATVLQNSKLGLSSAEVLQIANNMADCNGLLDYRPVTHMLRSQGLADSGSQSASCTGSATKKPPLSRPGSSVAALRSCSAAKSEAKHVCHAAAETTAPDRLAADASYHGSNLGPNQSAVAQQDLQTQLSGQVQQPAVQSEAKLQQTLKGLSCDASRASSGNAPSSGRPQTAPVTRVPGPPAQKVPYFFSKGQVNMEQPYKWMPSKDNTTIQDAGSKGTYERPWSVGHAINRHVKVQQFSKFYLPSMCNVDTSTDMSKEPMRYSVHFGVRQAACNLHAWSCLYP